jgi:hypothetical protein
MPDIDDDDWIRMLVHPLFNTYHWSPDDVFERCSFDDILFYHDQIIMSNLQNEIKSIIYSNPKDPPELIKELQKEMERVRGYSTDSIEEDVSQDDIKANLKRIRLFSGGQLNVQ